MPCAGFTVTLAICLGFRGGIGVPGLRVVEKLHRLLPLPGHVPPSHGYLSVVLTAALMREIAYKADC